MRQAGRFLPEYRKIRDKHDVIAICKNPDLCAEVTSMPVEALGVDAAIMFADIMLPLEGMGIKFEIKEGVGPIIKDPILNLKSATSLEILNPEHEVGFVLDAIKTTKKLLASKVPLIGFCGAPFTLASYMIEGHPTRDFIKVKTMMYRDPTTWRLLMGKLAESMSNYLQAQIRAGVDAVQLFDSWVGYLNQEDYREYVLPYSRKIMGDLEKTGVPRIHFGTDTSHLLELMKEAGGDVFGVDWRIPIDNAWERLGPDVGIQGNLDPSVLLGDLDLVESRASDILARVSGRRGHIFNLGHGMLPDASTENTTRLVGFVHERTSESE
jgi:uroporphyrinogen decarboxylase